jgi:Flp pilus assembly protein TadD
MQLGRALKEQGRFQEAESSLLTALRLQETSPVLNNLGALYYQEGRFGEAAEYFERSLKGEPPNSLRYEDLGDAYRRLGDSQGASAAYQKAQTMIELEMAQNPREPFSIARLARLSALLGERNRAEFEISQALGWGSGNVRVLRGAVFTFETLEEREKTLDVLRSAPLSLLEELNNQPDMNDLHEDRQFQELLRNKAAEK